MRLKLFKALADLLLCRANPIAFFRSKGVVIGEGTMFYGPSREMFGSEPYLVKLGRGCHITGRVTFITHDGSVLILRHKYPTIDVIAPIIVGDRVFIGFGATILAGVRIGDDCIIAAGAVVSKDVASRSVVGGVPARFIKSLDEYEVQALAKSVDTKLLAAAEKKSDLLRRFGSLLEEDPGNRSGSFGSASKAE